MKEITPKLLKKVYQFLEGQRDEPATKLLEAFVGALRGIPRGSNVDVELYIRKHEGLIVAMNKLDERTIKGDNVKAYFDVCTQVDKDLAENEMYSMFIPFFVWLKKVCLIVGHVIEEKQIEHDIDLCHDQIQVNKHEISKKRIIIDALSNDHTMQELQKEEEDLEKWRAYQRELNTKERQNDNALKNFEQEYFQGLN